MDTRITAPPYFDPREVARELAVLAETRGGVAEARPQVLCRLKDLLKTARTEAERAWARVGRVAAYVAAIGFFLMTALYLLDQTDLLDPSPEYVRTAAGQLQDEARFWAQAFEHQHRIVWDVIVRDVVGPAAFVALIVVGKPVNLDQAKAVKQTGKAKKAFEQLFAEIPTN